MKKIITIAIVALIALSCDKGEYPGPDNTIPVDDLVPRKDIQLTRSQAEYVKTGGNEFALNLFKEVAGDENMVISPLSVTFALGMADNGASGNTKAEIEKVLGYEEESVEGLNSFCKTMMESAQEIDPSTKIEFANAAVVNSLNGKLKEEYKNLIETNYSAEICNMEFGKDPVKDFINSWCEQKTHGMIPELLPEEPLPFNLVHLLNAVYFKGIWTSQFKKEDSRKEDFKDIEGKKHKVNMMHQEDRFDLGFIPNICTALKLPFGNQAYHMVFILPYNADGFNDLKKNLDLNLWNDLSSKFGGMKVDVKIPSFETTFGAIDLNKSLQNLGMIDAFNPNTADFSPMCDTPGLYINAVLHKAKIKVDEQGSEAAAVTDVIIGWLGAGPNGPSELPVAKFYADRPFIYAITEVSTGAILFMGQYTGK